MTEFKLVPGLVIRHAYLWRREAKQGREEATKDRPCVIVHVRQNEFQETEVFIAPITHAAPRDAADAMAIPLATKARLQLDDENSWIITAELNRFIWPGPDVRPVPGGAMAYGYLPAAMTRDLVEQIRQRSQSRALEVTGRDDEELLRKTRALKQSDKDKTPGED